MHYIPNVDLAFNSVEHIMRDVNYGWLLRYTHANVASFFFIFVYAHLARGLYYNSYKSPRVAPWSVGVIILVLMMATAFLGQLISLKWLNVSNYETFTLSLSGGPTMASLRLQTILSSNKLTPVALWEDLHLSGVKANVLTQVKNFADVYLIINLINGLLRWYVGSAITGRMGLRFHKHLYSGSGSSLV